VVSLSVRILDSCLLSESSAMAINQVQFQPGLSMPEFFASTLTKMDPGVLTEN
jgi:hypothetical protein